MTKNTLNFYEGMYILNATLSEEARKKALKRISDGVEERQGNIIKIQELGRQKLAYSINNKKEGVYYIIQFSIKPSCIEELYKDYKLNEDLIRFITIVLENNEDGTKSRRDKKQYLSMDSQLRKIDYKDADLLRKFITERGKILPRRITGVSFYHQKQIKKAIKKARQMALVPFVSND